MKLLIGAMIAFTQISFAAELVPDQVYWNGSAFSGSRNHEYERNDVYRLHSKGEYIGSVECHSRFIGICSKKQRKANQCDVQNGRIHLPSGESVAFESHEECIKAINQITKIKARDEIPVLKFQGQPIKGDIVHRHVKNPDGTIRPAQPEDNLLRVQGHRIVEDRPSPSDVNFRLFDKKGWLNYVDVKCSEQSPYFDTKSGKYFFESKAQCSEAAMKIRGGLAKGEPVSILLDTWNKSLLKIESESSTQPLGSNHEGEN